MQPPLESLTPGWPGAAEGIAGGNEADHIGASGRLGVLTAVEMPDEAADR